MTPTAPPKSRDLVEDYWWPPDDPTWTLAQLVAPPGRDGGRRVPLDAPDGRPELHHLGLAMDQHRFWVFGWPPPADADDTWTLTALIAA